MKGGPLIAICHLLPSVDDGSEEALALSNY